VDAIPIHRMFEGGKKPLRCTLSYARNNITAGL
jgi:hypothetical protein